MQTIRIWGKYENTAASKRNGTKNGDGGLFSAFVVACCLLSIRFGRKKIRSLVFPRARFFVCVCVCLIRHSSYKFVLAYVKERVCVCGMRWWGYVKMFSLLVFYGVFFHFFFSATILPPRPPSIHFTFYLFCCFMCVTRECVHVCTGHIYMPGEYVQHRMYGRLISSHFYPPATSFHLIWRHISFPCRFSLHTHILTTLLMLRQCSCEQKKRDRASTEENELAQYKNVQHIVACAPRTPSLTQPSHGSADWMLNLKLQICFLHKFAYIILVECVCMYMENTCYVWMRPCFLL